MSQLKGAFTALITPFLENGLLDEQGLRSNIRFQIREEIHGVVALGTTGEAPTLSEQEQVRVLQIAKEECAGQTHLMAGTGTYSTEQTVKKTRLAEELGVDSCLVITPYYNKPNQKGIFEHFKTIAESVQIPIVIYHHPGRTGCRIHTDTLCRLANIPNIAGIKDCSGDLSTLSDWIEFTPSSFSVFSGDDPLNLPIMALGGQGVISVAANLFPKKIARMISDALKGDFYSARAAHYELTPFFRALSLDCNPIPIKAAMRATEFAAGPCRSPLTPIDEKHFQQLKGLLLEVCHG